MMLNTDIDLVGRLKQELTELHANRVELLKVKQDLVSKLTYVLPCGNSIFLTQSLLSLLLVTFKLLNQKSLVVINTMNIPFWIDLDQQLIDDLVKTRNECGLLYFELEQRVSGSVAKNPELMGF